MKVNNRVKQLLGACLAVGMLASLAACQRQDGRNSQPVWKLPIQRQNLFRLWRLRRKPGQLRLQLPRMERKSRAAPRPRPQNRTNRSRRLSPRRRNPAKIRPTEANPIVANPARLHPVVIVVSRPAEASPVAMDLLAVNPQAIHQLQNRLKQSPL